MGMRRPHRDRSSSRDRGHRPAGRPARRREAGIALHPRGPAPARPAAGRAAVGEPDPRPPDPAAERAAACWIDRSGARTEHPADRRRVRRPHARHRHHRAASLSGGNQQKLIVGREMSGDPVALMLPHPTRGVDVGAQAAIWDSSGRSPATGLAVLLISADLDERCGLSDRIRSSLRGPAGHGDLRPARRDPRRSARR